jgi:OOP family OmpA-OmpF porin
MSLRRILAGALIAGLAQLALMGSAAADVDKGPYVAVDGGLSWTSNQSYGAGTSVTYDSGFATGAQVGYSFGGPRVEFEYNYRHNNANTTATADGTQSASDSLSANSYLVNFIYDFDTGSKWVPYLGLGLGASDVKANSIHSSVPVSSGSYLDGGSTEFAGQFIVGVEFLASQHVGVFLDWRGLWVHSANMNYGTGCPGGGTTGCAVTGATNYYYYNGVERRGEDHLLVKPACQRRAAARAEPMRSSPCSSSERGQPKFSRT